ncbi:MAG: fused MFS/spermidine synthase [Planctomycetota bacterium]|nr:fused MFS/spermidine synthase [Planctomycetota bacterium]
MTKRTAFFAAVFLFGAYALCAQAVLLREAQVILFGSELSWGLVLAFWLAGVAVGARLGGRLAKRAWPAFAGAAVALPLVLVVAVALLRTARLLLGVGPGEYVGPGEMTLITLASTLPVSLWVGLSFPAASALAADERKPPSARARAVGLVYLVESAGGLLGGILFSFVLVERVDAITLAFAGGAMLTAAVAVAAIRAGQAGPAKFLPAACAALSVFFVVSGKAGVFNDSSTRLRWQSFAVGLDLVESKDSRYHNLAVGRLGDQFSLYANGVVAATWPNHTDLAVEANLAACEAVRRNRILVLGGGAEGLLKELLRYKPETLDYVTLDPQLAAVIGPYLADADRLALAGLGEHVHFEDIRRFVNHAAAARENPYDFIFLAAAEPASTLEARLYTEEFFRELASILSPDGVLAFALHGSVGYWGPEPTAYVASIVQPLQRVFPDTLLTFGYPTRCFAAKRKGVLTDSGAELARRYEAAGVQSPHFDPLWFKGGSDLLDTEKRAALTEALAKGAGAIPNTDDRPSAAMYHMRFWLQTGASSHACTEGPARQRSDVLGFLLGLRLEWVLMAAVAATALAAGAGLVRGRAGLARAAITWSVATTGFATMALEIVLLNTFQTLYGYVYGQVGLVIGVFMFGLVLGSWAMNRRLMRSEQAGADGVEGAIATHEAARRVSGLAALDADDVRGGYGDPPRTGSAPGLHTMLGLDVAIALFAAALMLGLGALRGVEADWVIQTTTYALVAVAGVLGGMVFPLASVLVIEARGSTGRAAAAVDAADNFGACLGAFITGVLLVPILGIGGACLAVAGVKVLSGCLLAAAGRP